MGDHRVLVLDAGTSRARCHVFDGHSRIVGSSACEYCYAKEDDASPLARAFDPEALWRSFCDIIGRALRESATHPDRIAAVSVTSQRQGVVFLDSEGHEIYAGPNLDLRAVFEGAAIDEEMRDRVYQTTGHVPSFLFSAAKLRWFQSHDPEAYGRIACVLTLADWLVWRLTGVLAGEPTLAAEAGLLEIHSRRWCDGLFADLGLVSNTLPLVEAGAVVAGIATAASEQTGLVVGTPVAMAGADTQCGLLGMGVADKHEVGVVAGWSAPLQMVTEQPILSPEGKTWAGCFLEPNKWVLESSAGDAGNAYRWLAQTLCGEAEDAFDVMDGWAGAVPAGSEGALAFLGPSRMDMTTLGLEAGGLLFPVPLTFGDVGRGHLVRASLEGIACAIRANLEQIEGLSGASAVRIAVGGGMTRTLTFRRVLADVIGREVHVAPTPEVSATGAYLCATVALGEFASLEEASVSVRTGLDTLEPDPLSAAEYDDVYERWVELWDQLRQLSL